MLISSNWILCTFTRVINSDDMLKRLKQLYHEYKPYVRVDLIMYAVLILLIIGYLIVSTLL